MPKIISLAGKLIRIDEIPLDMVSLVEDENRPKYLFNEVTAINTSASIRPLGVSDSLDWIEVIAETQNPDSTEGVWGLVQMMTNELDNGNRMGYRSVTSQLEPLMRAARKQHLKPLGLIGTVAELKRISKVMEQLDMVQAATDADVNVGGGKKSTRYKTRRDRSVTPTSTAIFHEETDQTTLEQAKESVKAFRNGLNKISETCEKFLHQGQFVGNPLSDPGMGGEGGGGQPPPPIQVGGIYHKKHRDYKLIFEYPLSFNLEQVGNDINSIPVYKKQGNASRKQYLITKPNGKDLFISGSIRDVFRFFESNYALAPQYFDQLRTSPNMAR